MIHRFDIAPVPLDIEKFLHFVHIFKGRYWGARASLDRAQWFGTRYRMCSRGTHRHVTGFLAAAVLLLLLVLPDSESESDRAELDSESPRQLDRDPGL